jgi:hypothetical protein
VQTQLVTLRNALLMSFLLAERVMPNKTNGSDVLLEEAYKRWHKGKTIKGKYK